VVRLSGGYEERAEAVLAPLARPGQAGSQVSTSQAPLGGACSVRLATLATLAELAQSRIASMSEGDAAAASARGMQPARPGVNEPVSERASERRRWCKSGRR
jgi:hypothetical protein